MENNRTLSIANAKLMWRNFAGAEKQNNPAGRRNFCIRLELDDAARLAADGWNIRYREPREPGDDKMAYLQVAVNYKNFPPKIVMITSKNQTLLPEEEVKILDWVEIASADVIINPYHWKMNGDTGIKAYLKALYLKIVEDEFADKYSDIPVAGPRDEDVG